MDIFELIRKQEIKHVRLTEAHEIKPFECGVEDLNEFLFNDSKIHLKHLHHTTFLLESEEETIAFYSLTNDLLKIYSIEDFRSDMDVYDIGLEYSERFFEQRNFPAVKIGRLAVNTKYQNNGVGKMLLDYLTYSFTFKNKTGCQYLTVDAIKDEGNRAYEFYLKNEFKLINDGQHQRKDSWFMYKCLLEFSKIE